MHPYKLYVYILYNLSSGLVWRGNSNTYLYRHRENWRKSNKKKKPGQGFFPINIAIVRESLFSCLHRITSPLPENPTPLRSHSLIALYTKILHAYSFRLFLGLSLSLFLTYNHIHTTKVFSERRLQSSAVSLSFFRDLEMQRLRMLYFCMCRFSLLLVILVTRRWSWSLLLFNSTKRTDCCPLKKVKWAFSTIQTILHCIAS